MRFEYDTLVLERKPGTPDHVYHWRCCRKGSCHSYEGLESFLNEMGQEGWHVAAYANGERFNCTVILQRRLDDDGNPGDQAPLASIAPSPSPSGLMRGLRDEVRAMAEQNAAVSAETREAFLSTVQALGEEIRKGSVFDLAMIPTAETIAEAIATRIPTPLEASSEPKQVVLSPDSLAGFDELIQQIAARSVSATISPQAVETLEQTLTTAVQQATTVSVEMFQRALEQIAKDRDRHDDSPGGPPIVTLDPETLQMLQGMQRDAVDQIQAALAREIVVRPEIQVDANAELSKASTDRLQAAITAGFQVMSAPVATLDEGSIQRLMTALVATSPSRVDAVLGQDVVTALQTAIAAIPPAVVQTRADLASESVMALSAVLSEALEAILCRIPVPTVEVSPAVNVMLDEAVLKRLSAQSVMLAPSSVASLQSAVAAAVAEALERHSLYQQAQISEAKQISNVSTSSEPTPRRFWWSLVAGRMRLALSR